MNGKYFDYLLSLKGLKRKNVAQKLGIAQTTLNKKIKGDIRITLEEIISIMKLLNMSFDEIFIKCNNNSTNMETRGGVNENFHSSKLWRKNVF